MKNMEKITENSEISDTIDRRRSVWFRSLIAALASYTAADVIVPLAEAGGKDPVKTTVDENRRHPSSLHSHAYPEICISMTGRALMELEDGVCEMPAPSIFFALPHQPHCQLFDPEQTAHTLAWMVYSGEAMLFNSSFYTPEGGWVDSNEGSLEGQDVRDVSNILDDLQTERGTDQGTGSDIGEMSEVETSCDSGTADNRMETVRSKLIAVVNRMYQRAVRHEASSDPEEGGALEYHKPVLRYVRSYIQNNLGQRTTLGELGEMARLSPNYLNELFSAWMGEPLHQYTIRRRMERAHVLLQKGDLLVKQIAREVGYDDPLYFSRAFHDFYGYWPTDVDPD